jgi:hypothetical protein
MNLNLENIVDLVVVVVVAAVVAVVVVVVVVDSDRFEMLIKDIED